MKIINQEIKEIFNLLDSSNNNYFKKKKILLLGSDGFLGRYFVEYFNFLGKKNFHIEVDCVDNNISSKHVNRYNEKKIKFYKKNIMKSNFEKKYDIIIFLAGIASPTIYKKYPVESLEVSYIGAKKFLEKSKKDNSNFIFLVQVKYMEIQM